MKLLIIDGQGGGVGRQLIENIKSAFPEAEILAVGTNALATQTMMKAGAEHGATGENAVLAACRSAEVIIGPIGIVVADSLYGEITPKMAKAVGQSPAKKLLIPINHCETIIVGVPDLGLKKLISEVLEELEKIKLEAGR